VTRIEKVLGIDKVGRESGSAHTLANYLKTLKDAAHARGIHISKRVIAYEEFVNGCAGACASCATATPRTAPTTT
jgi:hypothetical protein